MNQSFKIIKKNKRMLIKTLSTDQTDDKVKVYLDDI